MMPGLGGAKRGKELWSNCAMNAARPDTPHRGQDGDTGQSSSQWCRGERRGWGREASAPRVQRDAAGCHFESEAVKNFSFLQQTLGGQQFGGESVQTQLNVVVFLLCGGVARVIEV